MTNDEVIDVNQDALGDQAVTVSWEGDARVYLKKLTDGSLAVGLFKHRDEETLTVTIRWSDLKLKGAHAVRDLWRQQELGKFEAEFSLPVASHGAELVKISP